MEIYKIEFGDLENKKLFMESHSCYMIPSYLRTKPSYDCLGISRSSEYFETYKTFYLMIMDNKESSKFKTSVALFDDNYMCGMPDINNWCDGDFVVFIISINKKNGKLYTRLNMTNPNNDKTWNKYEEIYNNKISKISKIIQELQYVIKMRDNNIEFKS